MTIYLEPPFRKYQKIGQEKVDSIPISTLAVNFRATTAQSVIQIDKQSFFPTHNADAEKRISASIPNAKCRLR